MPLESLLLSRDPEVIRVLQPALEKLAIEVEVCRGVSSGEEILRTEKFDAIIVDCDDLKGALSVFEGLRKSASNKNSVTFAILERQHHHPAGIPDGREFCSAETNFGAERDAMLQRRGQFYDERTAALFRHPVEMPATPHFVSRISCHSDC